MLYSSRCYTILFLDMKKKRWIVIIAAILALGGTSFLVWQYVVSEPLTREPVISQQTLTESDIREVLGKAEESVRKNDYAGAYALIDAAIEETADNSIKASLITAKVDIAFEEENPSRALQLALDAYDIYPSSRTAQEVAAIYAMIGDKAKALEYYRLAIQLTNENDESINYVQYSETKITELEGQP